MAFPTTQAVIDNFDRANGALSAGAGSTLWSGLNIGGAAGGLSITGNALSTGTIGNDDVSLFDLPALFDVTYDVTGIDVAAGPLVFFFSLQNPATAGWEGYWAYVDNSVGNWVIRKRIATVTTTIATATAVGGVGVGDKVGIRRGPAGEISLFRYTAGAWNQTPVLTVTDSSIILPGKVSFEFSNPSALQFRIDNLNGGALASHYNAPMIIGGRGGGRQAARRTSGVILGSVALQDVVPSVDKAGAAAITGGGSTVATGAKGGIIQTPEAGGLPMLNATLPYGHVSGGGTITSLFSLTAGPAIVTGGGSTSATGRKNARGGASITGRGAIVVISGAGPTSRSGSAVVTGAGVTTSLGRKGSVVAISLSGGGSILVQGVRALPRQSILHGGGSISSLGKKNAKAIGFVTGAGKISVGTLSSGAVIIPDTRQPTWINIKQHQTVLLVNARTTFLVILPRNTAAVVKT